MNEYTFRKACIIVGIKGTEVMFRNYEFKSYRFLFSHKLFSNFLKYYINRIITTVIENKIVNIFENVDSFTQHCYQWSQEENKYILVPLYKSAVELIPSLESIDIKEANAPKEPTHNFIMDPELMNTKFKYKIGIIEKITENQTKRDIMRLSMLALEMFMEFLTKTKKMKHAEMLQLKEKIRNMERTKGLSAIYDEKNAKDFISRLQKKIFIDEY